MQSIANLPRKTYPVKVLQFGTGNFLRGFADWMIQQANNRLSLDMGVIAVQSVSSDNTLIKQDCVYTTAVRGLMEGKPFSKNDKIDVIQGILHAHQFEEFLKQAENPDLEIILSNTTETGIQFKDSDKFTDKPASTFPGKLTQLLYRRFLTFPDKPLAIIPCELIEKNGQQLKYCMLQYIEAWELPDEFKNYIEHKIFFYNTLVDRIVTGFPSNPEKWWEELGYTDKALTVCEPYHLWVIEGPSWIKDRLPLDRAGLNVVFTDDLEIYRLKKVRILNGLHSMMAPAGYLAGIRTVRAAVENSAIRKYIDEAAQEEIIPSIQDNITATTSYKEEVINRFLNPFIEHQLSSIMLYSFAKFRVRLLPPLLHHTQQQGYASKRIAFALAAMLFFYRGLKGGNQIEIKDEPYVVETLKNRWSEASYTPEGIHQLTEKLLSDTQLWKENLNEIPGLLDRTSRYLYQIDQFGVMETLQILDEDF